MPYDKSNPPAKLKGLSERKQKQWVEVFNDCWSEHRDDKKCHMMAWGVVKKEAGMNAAELRLPSAVERKLKEVEDAVSEFYGGRKGKGAKFADYIRRMMQEDDPHRWDFQAILDHASDACDELRMSRDERKMVMEEINRMIWGRTASRMAAIASRVAGKALDERR